MTTLAKDGLTRYWLGEKYGSGEIPEAEIRLAGALDDAFVDTDFAGKIHRSLMDDALFLTIPVEGGAGLKKMSPEFRDAVKAMVRELAGFNPKAMKVTETPTGADMRLQLRIRILRDLYPFG